jgi:hypothetical protein
VTTATAPVALDVARAVLIDRLAGLLHDRRKPQDPSRLQERLDEVLYELVTGVSRCTAIPDETRVQDSMERAIYASWTASTLRASARPRR